MTSDPKVAPPEPAVIASRLAAATRYTSHIWWHTAHQMWAYGLTVDQAVKLGTVLGDPYLVDGALYFITANSPEWKPRRPWWRRALGRMRRSGSQPPGH